MNHRLTNGPRVAPNDKSKLQILAREGKITVRSANTDWFRVVILLCRTFEAESYKVSRESTLKSEPCWWRSRSINLSVASGTLANRRDWTLDKSLVDSSAFICVNRVGISWLQWFREIMICATLCSCTSVHTFISIRVYRCLILLHNSDCCLVLLHNYYPFYIKMQIGTERFNLLYICLRCLI